MKKSIIILVTTILGFITLSFIELSETGLTSKYTPSPPPRSGGVAALLGSDKTGSPLSSNTCTQCHGSSNPNTTVSIEVLNSSNTAVTEYTPGEQYTIQLIVSNASLSSYGMQMVTLNSGNTQAGSLTTPSPNTQITNLSGVQYLEHNSAGSSTGSLLYSAIWTAPTAGSGTLTFYGVGIAVNGNGSTSGDQTSSPVSLQLTETIPTAIAYSNTTFCGNNSSELPIITGTTGGVFSSTPPGLTLNSTSGEIDFTTSTLNTYTITYIAGTETATTSVTINPTQNTTDAITICNGESYTFGSQTLDATNVGINTETFQSITGCDSTVTLTLTVISPAMSSVTATICDGDTYNFGTQTLDASNVGLNSLTLDNAAINGCDSIINLTLFVENPAVNSISATICETDTYVFGSQTLDATNVGLNTLTLPNEAANGCDSIVNLTLSVTSIDNGITVTNNTLISNQNNASYQWITCPDKEPITDSTNQSLQLGTSEFSYGVIITLNGCIDTSDCVTLLNIENQNNENMLSVFPNPSHGQLQIKGINNLNSIKSIQIKSINGAHIKTLPIEPIISISDLQKGIYIINITHSTGTEQLRFIKKLENSKIGFMKIEPIFLLI